MKKSVILCVDDETVVLRSLESQLSRFIGKEYSIEVAENGEEALIIIEDILKSGDVLVLVISDQIMPGIKGSELLHKIHEKSENTLKILLTGQADAAAVGYAVNNARLYRYISKPWQQDDLTLTVQEALRRYKQERQLETQNLMLKEYSEELEEKVKQRTHDIEIKSEQLRLAHQKIKSSIQYASRIQQAVLLHPDLIQQILPHSFIVFKPRDIVSGDFYFIKQVESHTILAAVDCTGHGVPGAFMSMLGVAILNEIVTKPINNKASLILDELRVQIKYALQQTGQRGEQHDGLDISLCLIDNTDHRISFAGANLPLWIFRSDELIELHGDRMPVGVHAKEKPFTEQSLVLQKNDMLYIFSDGFHSQFGGERNEKYKIPRMKALLHKIHRLEVIEQKNILENEFETWRGNLDQTDDILVIGLSL